jgi:hypothetical protein
LNNFLQAAKNEGINLQIGSGYRSVERQAQLWQQALQKYGSPEAARKWVAPPGRSMHNSGKAADLWVNGKQISRNSKEGEWAHANAAKYGLHFRMGNEPWHIEPTKGAAPETPKDASKTAPSGAGLESESSKSSSSSSASSVTPSGASAPTPSSATPAAPAAPVSPGMPTSGAAQMKNPTQRPYDVNNQGQGRMQVNVPLGASANFGNKMATPLDTAAQKKANDISDLSRKTSINKDSSNRTGPVTQNIAMHNNSAADTTGTGFPSKDNPMMAMTDTMEKFTSHLFGMA